VILSALYQGRTRIPARTSSASRPTTLELIEPLYKKAPHLTLYTPLCKVRDVLMGCNYLVSTNGRRLSSVVAYGDDSIELTWSVPERAETLRNLIVQVKNRVPTLTFLPVMETGRTKWNEELSLQVLGRCFRAIYEGPKPGPVSVPAGLRMLTVDPEKDLPTLADLMNSAYPSLPRFIDAERLAVAARAPSYYADGWFFLCDETLARPIGAAVCGYCGETDEGFIDWVQVLPRFRGRGLGVILAREAIRRLAAAGCITVSGSLDAPFAVGELYADCGFGQFRQWSILGQPAVARAPVSGATA